MQSYNTGAYLCEWCHGFIYDRFLLLVDGRRYHENCLRCSTCLCQMLTEQSCYLKFNKFYCRQHYFQKFGVLCNGCFRPVFPEDWTRHATNLIYHIACYVCISCKRQLSTGELYGISDNQLFCHTHYLELFMDPAEKDGACRKPKTKRMRTSFNSSQVQILHASFMLDCNPDATELDRLSDATGLAKRVIQVWFQNSRARQKKTLYPDPLQAHNSPLFVNSYTN